MGCIGFCFLVPLYTFCVLRGVLGFLCLLETPFVLVHLVEVLCAFFDI
jgi:hypothetical protein